MATAIEGQYIGQYHDVSLIGVELQGRPAVIQIAGPPPAGVATGDLVVVVHTWAGVCWPSEQRAGLP